MKLVIATHNQKKQREMLTILSAVLPNVEVLTLSDVGYHEDIEENGTTFEENALIKARVAAQFGEIGIADDSGLTVDALNGAPGIYSARFAQMELNLEKEDDTENINLLLKKLEGVPFEKRTAAFVSCIGVVLPDGKEFTVMGKSEGIILNEKRGNDGFGYDPVFYVPSFDKTYAELSAEQKNSISHRGKSLANLAKELKKLYDK